MRQSSALFTHATNSGFEGIRILKVLRRDEAERCEWPAERVLLWNEHAPEFAGSYFDGDASEVTTPHVANPRDRTVVSPGDVVRFRGGSSQLSVLYRRGANANTMLVTERCNSLCLMCSQPPREEDDSWRIDECVQLAELIDRADAHIGISGGEPTLLGDGLATILRGIRRNLPDTNIHVLTNGRNFRSRHLAETMEAASDGAACWAVPVYADVAEVHDQIVDAPGAFGETMLGLYELARLGARAEIRVVLHALSIPRLRQLAAFIYRRLPFASHVALMGLEPMGFAKRNRDVLWIDPADYVSELSDATHYLANRGMNVSIYNTPMCVLPADIRPYARQSISDWKNRAAPECDGCELAESCSGFFASAGAGWRSRSISPVRAEGKFYEVA